MDKSKIINNCSEIEKNKLEFGGTNDGCPNGLRNPQAYVMNFKYTFQLIFYYQCFLNSVLQLLFDCDDFRAKMINYVLDKSITDNDTEDPNKTFASRELNNCLSYKIQR